MTLVFKTTSVIHFIILILLSVLSAPLFSPSLPLKRAVVHAVDVGKSNFRFDEIETTTASLIRRINAKRSGPASEINQAQDLRNVVEVVSNHDPIINGETNASMNTRSRATRIFQFSWVLRLLRDGYQCGSDFMPCGTGRVTMRNAPPNDPACEVICSRFPAFESAEFECGACSNSMADSPTSPLTAPALSPSRPSGTSPTVVVPSSSQFEISISFVAVPSIDIALFDSARSRWSSIILGDLSDVRTSSLNSFDRRCAFPSIIDDMYICAIYEQKDGVGDVVGSAGPLNIRVSDGLTIDGFMSFDVADVEDLRRKNLWESVILHEMGHVLGIGTLWRSNGIQGGTLQCPYNGVKGNAEYEAITGCSRVPIELGGGVGTRCGHFDEECLLEELMTGRLNVGSNLLSKVTVGSLQDLGYKNLNFQQADQYRTSDVNPSCVCNRRLLHEENDIGNSKNMQIDGMQRRRKLSTEGRQKAIDYGKNLLATARTQYETDLEIAAAESNIKDIIAGDETGIKFVGGDVVSVLMKEEGELYGVVVHWDD